MERLFMLGRLKESFELVQNAAPHIKSVKGLICRQSIIFYSLLTRIGIHDSLDRSKQTVNKLMIKRFLKELGRFAELNENSFGCYYTLAKAEYNAYIREQQGGLYDRAAEMAEAQKNYKIAALANLLAAKRHNNSEKLRRLYVFESCRFYKLWGADFVCRHIEKEYGFIDGLYYKTNKLLLSSATRTKQELLHGFAKDSLGKSEDEVSSLFLTALIEAGIADYCCVVKREPGGLYLKHQMDKEGSARSYTERVNIKNLSRLPHRMLRYSLRTQEEVCVYPGREKKAFAADARIQSSPDTFFACVPIINCGITTGLLYIENSRAALDAQTLSEIKNLMPLLAVSFSAINGVDIKAMFEPAKKQTLLTNREMDILKLIEKGLSNEGISTELKLAIGTVKKHVSSILNKLGAENRIQAINIAKDKKVL